MSRLLVFADIHGSLGAWLTVRALLSGDDSLAVAGDLFDTRYGNYGNPDFQPDEIRSDLRALNHSLHYVYGNCDAASFCPGYENEKIFEVFGKRIGIHHGHRAFSDSIGLDVLIQGHTHLCHLERQNGLILMNPGSITSPRNQLATYGMVDANGAALVELKSGKILAAIPFE
ncbi:MAG: YfcE family phosphodiesterase [Desulfobacter sp.]|nr:MAG: YfcE family phosphodiesterase [Desulfobacter sp.]